MGARLQDKAIREKREEKNLRSALSSWATSPRFGTLPLHPYQSARIYSLVRILSSCFLHFVQSLSFSLGQREAVVGLEMTYLEAEAQPGFPNIRYSTLISFG